MRILDVTANNRNRTFEVRTRQGTYAFPYAKLDIEPGRENPIRDVFPDPEAGCEAFTCILESGEEDSVHLDAVLEYNRDPLEVYFDRILSMYRGDGWFIDGWNRGFDHYNFWGFQLYLHALTHFDARWRERYAERVRRWL